MAKLLCLFLFHVTFSIEHESYDYTDAIVMSDGKIYWMPPVTFHTSCDFDFTYWPWDMQTCSLVLASWSKTGNELNITNMNGKNVS